VKSKPAALLILVVVLGLLLPAETLAEFDVPDGFDDLPVVSGVPAPTAIDWLPASEGNDLLIATQAGVLFRHVSPATPDEPAVKLLDLSPTTCLVAETGLLGLAVDPEFSAVEQRFIYLYYTDKRGAGDCGAASRANRVSRFTMNGEDLLVNEQILIDNIPAPGGNHNRAISNSAMMDCSTSRSEMAVRTSRPGPVRTATAMPGASTCWSARSCVSRRMAASRRETPFKGQGPGDVPLPAERKARFRTAPPATRPRKRRSLPPGSAIHIASPLILKITASTSGSLSTTLAATGLKRSTKAVSRRTMGGTCVKARVR
jgi:hypothetical protein